MADVYSIEENLSIISANIIYKHILLSLVQFQRQVKNTSNHLVHLASLDGLDFSTFNFFQTKGKAELTRMFLYLCSYVHDVT